MDIIVLFLILLLSCFLIPCPLLLQIFLVPFFVVMEIIFQLKQAKDKAAEKFLAILFLYMADHQKYRKIIEDMENAVL